MQSRECLFNQKIDLYLCILNPISYAFNLFDTPIYSHLWCG